MERQAEQEHQEGQDGEGKGEEVIPEEEEGMLEWGGGEDLTCESVSDWGGGGCFLSPRTRLFWVCVQSVLLGVEGGRGSVAGCKGEKWNVAPRYKGTDANNHLALAGSVLP